MRRYVALGSSMAAGPGIRPSADGAPFRAGRSARNYPHLVAEKLGLDLVDVTHSGATTANILTDPQNGTPPQADALEGSEDLVTVTIGGNDAGYVPLLMAAGLPHIVRRLPLFGRVAEGSRPYPAPAVAAGQGAVRRLPDIAAARGYARTSVVRCRHRTGPPSRRHAGADHRRGRGRHRLWMGSRGWGKPRSPRLVDAALDK